MRKCDICGKPEVRYCGMCTECTKEYRKYYNQNLIEKYGFEAFKKRRLRQIKEMNSGGL